MPLLVHIVILLTAVAIIWFFAGVIIEEVTHIAKRYCKSSFFMAFFVLGFLTSISEFSVAINAQMTGVPQVSVGNLIGASFVIMLLVVPFLAVAGRGITLNKAVSKKSIILIMSAVALPALLVIDGNVTFQEGLLAILLYATVAYALYRQRETIRTCDPLQNASEISHATSADIIRILVAGVAIFIASRFLVDQAVYFANALDVPASLIGLLLLSLGTNTPEIVIAVRAVLAKRTDVALGDYLGSSATNTLLFGLLAVGAGPFLVEAHEFLDTTVLFVIGLVLFYFFIRSGKGLSRREGMVLLLVYLIFVVLQTVNVIQFATS